MTQVRACLICVYNVSLMRMRGKRGLVRGGKGRPFPEECPVDQWFSAQRVRRSPEDPRLHLSPIKSESLQGISICKAPQAMPVGRQGLAPLPESCAVQCGRRKARVATETRTVQRETCWKWEMHTGVSTKKKMQTVSLTILLH